MSGVEDRIERSASALRDLVWPVISDLVGGGGLIPVETVRESDFARILDTTGGIDAWQIYPGNGKSPKWIRGIASRVQFGDRDWSTHTVRYRLPSGNETELHKRLRYNKGHGVVGPHLTLQAYVDDTGPADRLLSVGIVRTADLLDAVMRERIGEWEWPTWERGRPKPGPVYIRTNGQDAREFLVVEWEVLTRYEHFLIWPSNHRLARALGEAT